MYSLLRRWLFSRDAEDAHHLTFRWFHRVCAIPGVRSLLNRWQRVTDASLQTQAFGLTFPNPLGLAAGLDKNAVLVNEFAALGFGFVEVGTVTPRPQPGNERPRLFRLPVDEAIINRMGFNNDGAVAIAARLRSRRTSVLVGGNIGRNKDTPETGAVADYCAAFRELHPVVDYFVVNVSSPNTPGLRALQDREPLTRLLSELQSVNDSFGTPRPLLLKIAPDLSDSQLDDVIAVVRETGTAGLVATNTTIRRDGLRTPADTVQSIGPGGLSGRPLTRRATEVIRYLSQRSDRRIPIIGVGGIHTPEDALEKLSAGATLLQLYSGLIYEGPRLVPRILRAIAAARTR
jgi:dihydroorotate dehydrogenase